METPVERRANIEEAMQVRAPCFIDVGIGFLHNQACAVYYHLEEPLPAVIDGDGIFQPSWKAQDEGWRLVKADTHFKVWVLRHVFGARNARVKLAPTFGSKFFHAACETSKYLLFATCAAALWILIVAK